MVAIIALIGVVIISLVAIKIGSVAYRMTGLDEGTASFQALSAFTGTGFTTREAELIVNNPKRRKIAKVLMVLGNAGIVSTVATLILAFSDTSAPQVLRNIAIIVIGLLALYWLAAAKWVNRALDAWIAERLGGVRYLGITEFQEVIALTRGYGISSIDVKPDSHLAGKTLAELRLGQEGMLVLAIRRGRELISSPTGNTRIEANDRVVCYGNLQAAKEITVSPQNEETARDSDAESEQ